MELAQGVHRGASKSRGEELGVKGDITAPVGLHQAVEKSVAIMHPFQFAGLKRAKHLGIGTFSICNREVYPSTFIHEKPPLGFPIFGYALLRRREIISRLRGYSFNEYGGDSVNDFHGRA